MPFYFLIVALAIVCVTARAENSIVMDNEDATLEGVWTNGLTATDKYGKDYRFAFCEVEQTASATYRPKIPTTGKYHVEIYYPHGANRSTNAPWLITHQGGTLTAKVNQQIKGGEWVRIGTGLTFSSGTKGFVRLENNTGEIESTASGKPVVVADAVRFVPASGGEAEPSSARSHAGSAIEVDDKDVDLGGSWIEITSTTRQRGQVQHYIPTKESMTATATFRPNLPKAGKYDVEVWYTSGSNRSAASPWVVKGADGETPVTLDQTKNDAQWVRLASDVNFAAGTEGYVQLHNGTGKNGSVVVADAVRFIPSTSVNANAVTPLKPGATFALNLEVPGGGTVTRSSDQIRYPGNSTITLTARADSGFVFGGWTGDVNRMKNPLTLTMNSDKRITANFWAAGSGAIMDNTEADFVGDWMNPEKAWGKARYDNYQFASTVAGQSTASATYRPNLPKAGLYDIYVWYTDGVNRATKAPWEIVCKDGKQTVQVNQTKNGGNWVLLAPAKEFEEGSKGYVRLTNNAEPVPSTVIADAVAFVFVGAP